MADTPDLLTGIPILLILCLHLVITCAVRLSRAPCVMASIHEAVRSGARTTANDTKAGAEPEQKSGHAVRHQ